MTDYVPVIDGGKATHSTSAAVVGGQLCSVSGDGTIAATTAASSAFVGVAAFDAAAGTRLTVCRGGQQLIAAAANVTAGQPVEAAAAGTVTPHTLGTNDGNIVGTALNTAVSGASVRVLMAR